jgi:predicted DNA-binding transcriptional regulator YafY
VVESIPAVTPPEQTGDRIEVDVAVGGDAWLKRLLLRLGTAARVVGPPEAASLLGDAAGQILDRYRRSPPG